jgi:DNA-binding SARP family transcriptional activator
VPLLKKPVTARPLSGNAAAFLQQPGPIKPILQAWQQGMGPQVGRWLVVAAPASPTLRALRGWSQAAAWVGETPQSAGLLARPFSMARFEARLLQRLTQDGEPLAAWGLVFDMDWVLLTPAASANVSVWGGAMQRLLDAGVGGTLSIYHRRHMPERVLLCGLHAHAAVVVPEGSLPNPHHLPAPLTPSSPARPRLDHWLGALSPSLALTAPEDDAPAAGTSSRLLGVPAGSDEPGDEPGDDDGATPADGAAERWKVRCFGALRVYRNDGQRIDWRSAGSASRKLRTLFAYLLLSGSRGATVDELCGLLWPDAPTRAQAANRLHHTINGLRKALAPQGADATRAGEHPYLLRQDQRYALRPPANTWVDVEDFEQLCRQGATLLRDGAHDEALVCLESALNLYSGDLFADLPAALTGSRDPDWCWSRRYWFREMYFKVHRDCASIHRAQGSYLQAIQHCQQALQRDPACELAHSELMRVYARQGRRDALERQYRLYRRAAAAAADGTAALADPVHPLYVQLMQELRAGIP